MIRHLADRLFEWFCDPECYADISGDLEELYFRNKSDRPVFAQWRYFAQVLILMRPSIAKPLNLFTRVPMSMYRNYFKISGRNMMRHKVFSLINIMGLAIGLAAFILITAYVRFERSYDRISDQADSIFRISTVSSANGVENKDAMAYYPLKAELDNQIPEIQLSTITKYLENTIVKVGDDLYRERTMISGDANFLQLFPYKVIQGAAGQMLNSPNSIVLTDSKAKTYFGEDDPVGQVISLKGELEGEFTITGVIEDVPENTHYRFDMIVSDESIKGLHDYNSWNYNNYYLFVQLDPSADPKNVLSKLQPIMKKNNKRSALTLVPLTRLHLYSDYTFEPGVTGNPQVVGLMELISILIISIALVNYINLTTTRAMTRSREVGIRKVVGARKKELITQFMLEAFIVNSLALVVALILVEMLIPFYNQLVGYDVLISVFELNGIWLSLLVIFLTGSILSGVYPSLVLSGFEPVKVLKGKLTTSRTGIVTRKTLVVFQFVISLLIVGGALVIYEQIRFISSMDLGMDPNAVVTLTAPGIENEEEYNYLHSMKNEFLNGTSVEHVGFTSNSPGGLRSDINSTRAKVNVEGIIEDLDGISYIQFVDGGFFDVMRTRLLAGRNIDLTIASDSSALIMNRAYMNRLGVSSPERLIGKSISLWGQTWEIAGIVEDFNRTSVKSAVEPTLYIASYAPSQMVVRLNSADITAGLDYMEEVWKKFYPEHPFAYQFVDSRYEALYDEDRRFARVSIIFSGLTIFIAMLGLYGLISFMTTLRTREVGIRKVLGASLAGIYQLFAKEFVVIIIIAAVICSPLIYYLFNNWLSGYASHIAFPFWVIPVSFIALLGLSMLIISTQLMKVMSIDPADTLKYE